MTVSALAATLGGRHRPQPPREPLRVRRVGSGDPVIVPLQRLVASGDYRGAGFDQVAAALPATRRVHRHAAHHLPMTDARWRAAQLVECRSARDRSW